jgi:N-acetylmuramoyl-L-alanine amidase
MLSPCRGKLPTSSKSNGTGGFMKCEVHDNMLFVNGQQVEFRESPNVGRKITPTIIVIHYTGDNSMEGAVSWLCAAQSGVSAHLVIGKDGSIVQLVPFNMVAWHARGHYNGLSVNSHSIGIENVGIGDSWPDEQVEAIRAVVEVLFAAYPVNDVIGHVDIPDRTPGKSDPGPNFPWDKVTV